MIRRFLYSFISLLLILLFGFPVALSQTFSGLAIPKAYAATYPPTSGTQHYLYTFPDGNMYVYDMDNNFQLVYNTTLPGTSSGIRGSVISPTDNMLYVSYGGDGGAGSS